jgi:hypothetical protein
VGQLSIGDLPADVQIEPLALRVPVECFYARFGSFTNFLWFQDTLARWGGDLRNLAAQRGLDYQQSQHMERQLALHQTALSRLLGEAVVSDAAIIGSDMDLINGAAIGILFYARNALMGNDIGRQRQEALKSNPGATEKKLTIDGHTVSFLSSPDGTIRSFYVADGSYHFVTTSETLARRFLATRSGDGALGTSKEFRYARSLMPVVGLLPEYDRATLSDRDHSPAPGHRRRRTGSTGTPCIGYRGKASRHVPTTH